jgi:hypothetical protein
VSHHLKMLLFAAVAAAGSMPAALAADPNALPSYPDLGRYANFFASVCGKQKVDTDPRTIPAIGCFAIKAGGSLSGTINDRQVTIRLDAKSIETVAVDGTDIARTGRSTTNDSLVKPTATGFSFCSRQQPDSCPVQIEVMMRQPGEFATFDVQQQIGAHSFVTNQENWDAERSRPH